MIRELTCIGCPMGCNLVVEIENEEVIKVTGNTCKRGEDYGRKECTNPTRVVTSTVRVLGGEIQVVSVKTDKDISKEKVTECISLLKDVEINAPVKIGDVVVENILGTGANIVCTRNVPAKIIF